MMGFVPALVFQHYSEQSGYNKTFILKIITVTLQVGLQECCDVCGYIGIHKLDGDALQTGVGGSRADSLCHQSIHGAPG